MDEISRLRKELAEKDEVIAKLKAQLTEKDILKPVTEGEITEHNYKCENVCQKNQITLSNPEISRYSRQLILPEIAVKGQVALKQTSVLIVGAGGLGCPAAIYLAAAGVGHLGIVDYDDVELSNLHRQILHTENRSGVPKSVSAAHACTQLNSQITCVPYHLALSSQNALQLIKKYDIVVDATDNVATRYLLNDACVLAGKPLVSGSALRFEGQLTVYNHKGGPCYRCLYPKPPPPETVTNCSDGGVLGVVPGIIGCIQALEVIKIATGAESSYSGRLLLFDALQGSFRSIRLRGKQDSCCVCGPKPEITHLIDYEQFCGALATDKSHDLSVLDPEDRITVQAYSDLQRQEEPHILVDVRQPVELEICQLRNSLNIPLDQIDKEGALNTLSKKLEDEPISSVFLVCRRGNDSQVAVHKLREKFKDRHVQIKDIRGGLTAWAKHVDKNFPVY